MLSEVTAARPGIIGMRLDLDDPGPLSRFTEEVRFRFPDLNVLMADAGISRSEDLMANNWDASTAADMVETNILGVLSTTGAGRGRAYVSRQDCTRAVARALVIAHGPRRYGAGRDHAGSVGIYHLGTGFSQQPWGL